ncbi:MAG: hypothetical protein NVS2B14_05070 [Chamaesiphon sp.]
MSPLQLHIPKIDSRPPVAIGHVRLTVTDVPQAVEFFLKLGLRHIHQSENIAVLELRGGTHLVLRATSQPILSGTNAPFDLMVDDVEATLQTCVEMGMKPSENKLLRLTSLKPEFSVACIIK